MRFIAASIFLANIFVGSMSMFAGSVAWADEPHWLSWNELPPVPDELGFAGPFAGVHNDALIIAGRTNFAQPVWENEKQWHDDILYSSRTAMQETATGTSGKTAANLPNRSLLVQPCRL